MHERNSNGSAAVTTPRPEDGSQSTQLLNFVLGRRDPPRNALRDKRNAPVSEDVHQEFGSTGSRDNRLSPAHEPENQLQGVMTSETQPQGIDEYGPQKESAPGQTLRQIRKDVRSFPIGILAPVSLAGRNVSSLNDGVTLNRSAAILNSSVPRENDRAGPVWTRDEAQRTRLIKSRTGTSPSPSPAPILKTNTHSRNMRFRRPRSRSPSSQDSFAGPSVLQDPELFIATSRVFGRPLDKLGQPGSAEPSRRNDYSESEDTKDTGEKNPDKGSLETRGYSLSHSSAGRILVGNSDSSGESQDSHNGNSAAVDASYSQQATQVVEDSADYILMSMQNVETQAVDDFLQPQFSTPLSVGDPAARMDAPQREATQAEVVEDSILQNLTASSDARSILSLVPPEKWHRYMHHFGNQGGPISLASHAATSGTPVDADRTMLPPHSSLQREHGFEGEIIQDSVEQNDLITLSPCVGERKNMPQQEDHAVILASVSDPPDSIDILEKELRKETGAVQDEQSKSSDNQNSEQQTNEQNKFSKTRTQDENVGQSGRNEGGSEPSNLLMMDDVVLQNADIRTAATANGTGSECTTPVVAPRTKAKDKVAGVEEKMKLNEPSTPHALTRAESRRGIHNLRRGKRNGTLMGKRPSIRKANLKPPTPSGNSPSDAEYEPSSDIPLIRRYRCNAPVDEVPTEPESAAEESELTEDDMFERASVNKSSVDGRNLSIQKRKREASLIEVKQQTRSKGKTPVALANLSARRLNASTTAPPSKKQRRPIANVAASGSRSGLCTVIRVFALYKGDSCYYSAQVLMVNGSRVYVRFSDGEEDQSLGITQIRMFEIRNGDTVLLANRSRHKAKVIDDSLWRSENEFRVQFIEGPEEGLELVLEPDGIRIPARIVQSQWKDRTLDVSDIEPETNRRALNETPSSSKMSIISIGSARALRSRIFDKYGFVITQGPGNSNWEREKERMVSVIGESGGTVLADWQDIFSMQGKHTNANKRWTIQPSDMRYSPKPGLMLDRVFLLSDVPHQKSKFLLALALGIPCVSSEWLEGLARGEATMWSKYLLPAGYSEVLNGSVSQMVDLDWGSTVEHLTEIMENMVPRRVLSGMSVLCLGADLMPLPSKKSVSDLDKTLEASRMVPRIIVCMGASSVEAVVDVKHASARNLLQYDLVVVKDSPPSPIVPKANYVDVSWIKECLIACRLLEFPPW